MPNALHLLSDDLYVGLSGIKLGDQPIRFSRGITLQKTYAHLIEPILMAFSPVPAPGLPHPAPWKNARGSSGTDITAQLYVPGATTKDAEERMELAWTITFLIRICSTPAVTMMAMSTMPFSQIATAPDGAAEIIPSEQRRRTFALHLETEGEPLPRLEWEVKHFETAARLREESTEFRTAALALDAGQYISNYALTLISLWGALEALFSPSTSELRFRVSSLLASYLYDPGAERLEQQKRIAGLYDKRSAAAHGKPKHAREDLGSGPINLD